MKSNLLRASEFLDAKEQAVALSTELVVITADSLSCHETPANRVDGYQVKSQDQGSVKGRKQRI